MLSGQSDTIYLNQKRDPSEGTKPAYFRVITFIPERNQYRIADFYLDGRPHTIGYSDEPDAAHFIGKVITYGREGEIVSIKDQVDYQQGWNTFYGRNGTVTGKFWCVNGKKDGRAYFYREDGSVYATALYKADKPFEKDVPQILSFLNINPYNIVRHKKGVPVTRTLYYENGRRAMVASLEDKYVITKATFYLPSGKKIGDCIYSNGKPVSGTCLVFSEGTGFAFGPARITHLSAYHDSTLISQRAYDLNGIEIGECTYRYNAPYSGNCLVHRTLKTYHDGINTGRNIEYADDLSYVKAIYEVVNGRKDGIAIVLNERGDTIASGIYHNNEPLSGMCYNRGEKGTYVNGLLHGRVETFDKDGKMIAFCTYVNGVKEGEAVHYYDTLISPVVGVFKSGKPFSGRFSNSKVNPVITEYENGVKIRETTYNMESFTIYREESFRDGRVKEYDNNGTLLFDGTLRDGKPWEGVFRENQSIVRYENGKRNGVTELFETRGIRRLVAYVDGKIHGEVVVYKDSMEVARGTYVDNKPWEGTFIDSRQNVTTYRNGSLNGRVMTAYPGYRTDIPYEDGLKNGEAHYDLYLSSSGKRDTIRYSCVFIDDGPYDGTIVEDLAITEYASGVKHGQELLFITNLNTSPVIENLYVNGVREGVAHFYIEGRQFTGQYNNGMPQDGYFATEPPKRNKSTRYPQYRDGVQTDNYIEYTPMFILMEYRAGQPYNGYIRNVETGLCNEYDQGRLVRQHGLTGSDTLFTTHIDGTRGWTYHKSGRLIGITDYTNEFKDGITRLIYSSDTAIIEFRDNLFYRGCHEMSNLKEWSYFGLSKARICKDDSSTKVELLYANSRLRIVRTISEILELPWPLITIPGNLGKIIEGGTTEFYDIEEDRLICTSRRKGYDRSGIEISQNQNLFSAVKFGDDPEMTEGTWEEVTARIQLWQQE